MPQTNITEAWLKRVAPDPERNKPASLPPGVDREKYWDESTPGFGVLLGRRFATFIVQHRVDGKQTLVTIGRYGRTGAGERHGDVWTVERAWRRARELLGAMSSGVNPVAVERASEATLREAFEEHKRRLSKKVAAGQRSQATVDTIDKTIARLEKHDKILDRPLAEITGEVLAELHEEIKERVHARTGARNEKGAPVANRVIANISAAWNTMNKKLEGKLGNWNPARSIERDTLVPKRVRVDNDKLPDWYARVQTMRSPIQRDGLVFALFTGLRNEDVRTARFENVDDDADTLRLPDPKGGPNAAFTIPLPQTCIDIIERRREDNRKDLGGHDDDGWIFPGPNADGEIGPIADLRQQIYKKEGEKPIKTRFPSEDVHTLRRTWESVAHEAGVSELDQHVLSNHSFGSHNVNATYISQHIDHLAKCATTIEAALQARIDGTHKPAKAKRAKLRAV